MSTINTAVYIYIYMDIRGRLLIGVVYVTGQGTHIINCCTGSRSSLWTALDLARSNTAVTQATYECKRDDSLQRNVLEVPLSNNRDPHDKPQGFYQSEYEVKFC